MNKYFIIFLAIVFSSCSQIINQIVDDYNYSLLPGFEIVYRDFGDIETLGDVSRVTAELCPYAYEGINNYYQSPGETLERGCGDCDDRSILFMNIAYVELGVKCGFAGTNSRTVYSGGLFDHWIIEYCGRFFDPISMKEYSRSEICYYYTFDEVFY